MEREERQRRMREEDVDDDDGDDEVEMVERHKGKARTGKDLPSAGEVEEE